MRGSASEIEAIEMDGEKIKDTTALDELVKGTYSGLVVSTQAQGTNTATPPANNGGSVFSTLSLAEKMKYANDNPNDQSVREWLGKK